MSASLTRKLIHGLVRNFARALFLFSLALLAALPALAQDTQPPVLTSFTFSPTAINTTAGPATISVTSQATDNLSGVDYVYADFVSPSGDHASSAYMYLSSGTSLNGTFTASAYFPAYSEGGTWTVEAISVTDNVGNVQYYSLSQIQALGFPTQLIVTSDQDTQPPVLTGFTFSPTAINTTAGSATISGTSQATDNLSGVDYVYADFVSPSGDHASSAYMYLSSGTSLNGTFTASAYFPAYSEGGTWTVEAISVTDNVGNLQYYNLSQIQALGFPTQLIVTSDQDTQPPVLTGFTFSPTAINTTAGSATISVTSQATDNLSGVDYVYADFVSPSGDHASSAYMYLSSGTSLNGTFTASAYFPAYSEGGTWTVEAISVTDNVGNVQYYSLSQIQALGFPTQLIVDSATSVALTSSANPSAYDQSVIFTATVTSSNGNIPTGTVNFLDGSAIIGSGTLSAGVTAFSTSSLAVASHTITADYLGDPNNPIADSAPLTQVVNKAATTTTIVSSVNPSIAQHPVTFTATVSFAEGPPPDGDHIQFFDGTTQLGTGTLTAGTATFTTSHLKVGNHPISAKYIGDSNLQSSKSAALKQRVLQ